MFQKLAFAKAFAKRTKYIGIMIYFKHRSEISDSEIVSYILFLRTKRIKKMMKFVIPTRKTGIK